MCAILTFTEWETEKWWNKKGKSACRMVDLFTFLSKPIAWTLKQLNIYISDWRQFSLPKKSKWIGMVISKSHELCSSFLITLPSSVAWFFEKKNAVLRVLNTCNVSLSIKKRWLHILTVTHHKTLLLHKKAGCDEDLMHLHTLCFMIELLW